MNTAVGIVKNSDGQVMLVDIGLEGVFAKLLPLLGEVGIAEEDIMLAVITHSHGDHAGDIAIQIWIRSFLLTEARFLEPG
ncbi:MAG: MBL fold metallo-hydrolase [Deltaproteobacteria bacterium]|nr:MBL fold metallo-hydrolase [Deltaproteobacteria bacterium]